MKLLSIFKRGLSTVTQAKPKICIVGAGPAGFYTAQHLVKKLNPVEIDLYEKLPVPFGLVRSGVAPDHPEVKNVINTFSKTAEHENIRFIGNISLGTNVSLKQLRQAYHVVVLTYGAEENRKLNIPGEDFSNVFSARSIVGWYNGTPWDANLNINLNSPSIAIFGQGNVAIDVARILLRPVDELKTTDITKHALDALSESKVEVVHLIGRRGPLQAAFTIKELRELLKLSKCKTVWCRRDFDGISEIVPTLARPKKRITELMLKSLEEDCKRSDHCRLFKPKFLRSPLKIAGSRRAEEVVLSVNKLDGTDILSQRAIATNDTETLKCDMVVSSIGYKSVQVDPDIPFDFKSGTAKNLNGKIDEGLYVAGWLATGPSGVILTTMSNAFATADLILQDIQNSSLTKRNKQGYTLINEHLKKTNVRQVSWKDWLKIDKHERELGKKANKPREKLLDVKKMLEIIS